MSRLSRLASFSHVGLHRYFLTFCAFQRHPVFQDADVVAVTLEQFRRTTANAAFVILAYCLMPDHAHLLLVGMTDCADLRRCAKLAKQRNGGVYARRTGQPLWQEGYYDRVLRNGEDSRTVARYILENPLRAGLVTTLSAYPSLGSDRWSLAELIEGLY
jgi:putative transposase